MMCSSPPPSRGPCSQQGSSCRNRKCFSQRGCSPLNPIEGIFDGQANILPLSPLEKIYAFGQLLLPRPKANRRGTWSRRRSPPLHHWCEWGSLPGVHYHLVSWFPSQCPPTKEDIVAEPYSLAWTPTSFTPTLSTRAPSAQGYRFSWWVTSCEDAIHRSGTSYERHPHMCFLHWGAWGRCALYFCMYFNNISVPSCRSAGIFYVQPHSTIVTWSGPFLSVCYLLITACFSASAPVCPEFAPSYSSWVDSSFFYWM